MLRVGAAVLISHFGATRVHRPSGACGGQHACLVANHGAGDTNVLGSGSRVPAIPPQHTPPGYSNGPIPGRSNTSRAIGDGPLVIRIAPAGAFTLTPPS